MHPASLITSVVSVLLSLAIARGTLAQSIMGQSIMHHSEQSATKGVHVTKPAGALAISSAHISVKDSQRGKELPLKITHPEGPGPYPVIIFSHGAGASRDAYAQLIRYWSSHGYVCVQPTHDDSIKLQRQRGHETSMLSVLQGVSTDYAGWQNRARDLAFVINSLPLIAAQAPQLQGKLDIEHIGVGGHSYGAFASALIGGATIDIPRGGPQLSFANERAAAFLLMSPQGIDPKGFGFSSEAAFKHMSRPLMLMTGSKDGSLGHKSPQWRTASFKYSPPGNKYLLFIEGATHMTFAGPVDQRAMFAGPAPQRRALAFRTDRGILGGALREKIREKIRERMFNDPRVDAELFDYVKQTSLLFWDAYLKSDEKSKALLASGQVSSTSKGAASLKVR